jgi:hypothetical protein
MGLWVRHLEKKLLSILIYLGCSEYEGLLSSEIKEKNDKWEIWKDG